MKRIFLACAFIVATGVVAIAQNTKQTPVQETQADAKIAFSSKINEMNAIMSRGNVELAQSKFAEAAKMMLTSMNINKNMVETNVTKEEKARLIGVINKQQHLYVESVTLSKEMKKNNRMLNLKMNEFLNTL